MHRNVLLIWRTTRRMLLCLLIMVISIVMSVIGTSRQHARDQAAIGLRDETARSLEGFGYLLMYASLTAMHLAILNYLGQGIRSSSSSGGGGGGDGGGGGGGGGSSSAKVTPAATTTGTTAVVPSSSQ